MEKPSEEKSPVVRFSRFSFIHTMERNYPWLYWTCFYSLFIFSAILVTFFYVLVVYPVLGLSDTNVNSARYLLSSLIQAEAAIIAIVISLTLVAMQMVATSYSPRVIRIFSSGNQMYVILEFYIVSIALSAIFLQMLQGETGPISPFHEYLVSFSLWSSIFLMIALVPYIRNVLTLLSPETIISLQCQTISKNSIISRSSESNPLDLIFDTLHQSIMKFDTGLVKHQLPRVTHAVITVLSEPLTENEFIGVTKDYSQRLTACAQQSIQLDDMESSLIILENLKILASCTIAAGNDDASERVIGSVQVLAKGSIIRKSWVTVTRIIDVLQDCGTEAIGKNLESTTARICICLKQVIRDSIDCINHDEDSGPFYTLAERSIILVSVFARSAITCRRDTTRDMIIAHLEDIGRYSWKNEQVQFVQTVADQILDLWQFTVEQNLEVPRLPPAAYEAYSARNRWLERYRIESERYEHKIMRIGVSAKMNDMKDSTDAAVILLAFFRSLDSAGYEENLHHFYMGLNDEKERAAYRHVFEASVSYGQQVLENL